MLELENIESRRRKLGLTQMELAGKIGVSQSLIAKIESGRVDTGYSIVGRIFETLEKLEDMKSIKAEELMSKKLYVIKSSDNVSRVIRTMNRYGFSQLPVFKEKAMIGVITQRRILNELLLKNGKMRSLSKMKAESFVEKPFPIIRKKTPINVVVEYLKNHSGVFVGENGNLDGVITRSDVIKAIGGRPGV